MIVVVVSQVQSFCLLALHGIHTQSPDSHKISVTASGKRDKDALCHANIRAESVTLRVTPFPLPLTSSMYKTGRYREGKPSKSCTSLYDLS